MSVSVCLQHPGVPLLRSQMVGRLLAHATTPFLKDWSFMQRRARSATTVATAPATGCNPVGLVPLSPSLSQAGGLQRMILRGHAAGITKILLSPTGVDVITGALLLGRRLQGQGSASAQPCCLVRSDPCSTLKPQGSVAVPGCTQQQY